MKKKVPVPDFAANALRALQDIAKRLAPCKHRDIFLFRLGDYMWCQRCGAMRAMDSDVWNLPIGQWVPPPSAAKLRKLK